MPFAGETDMYMSVPSCNSERVYEMRTQQLKPMHHIHRELEKVYQIERSPVPSDYKHQAFFKREPCEYTRELYDKQTIKLKNSAHIINCYDTYPSSKLSTALYNKKMLGFRDAAVFSLCDQGSSCPILAVQLACLYHSNTIIICMEEMYGMSESWDEGRGYPKSDAAALIQLSPDFGDWKVVGFDRQWSPRSSPNVQSVADLSITLIQRVLAQSGALPRETLILPQRLNFHYEERIGRAFPHVYMHHGQENFLTADPFYSLEQLHAEGIAKDWPYILLNFADYKAVGCLLLLSA